MLFRMNANRVENINFTKKDFLSRRQRKRESWPLKWKSQSDSNVSDSALSSNTTYSDYGNREAHKSQNLRFIRYPVGEPYFYQTEQLYKQKQAQQNKPQLSIGKVQSRKYWTKPSHGKANVGTKVHHPFVSQSPSPTKSLYNSNIGYRTKRSSNKTLLSDHSQYRSLRQMPPEYMVRLFQLLSGTHYSMMRNVIVTGFVNINDEEDYLDGSGGGLPQTHEFVFDVSIRQDMETMQYAELRLYVILKSRETGVELDNQYIIYSKSQSHDISIFEIDPHFGHRLIALKSIRNVHKTWISFNITSALKQWASSGLRILEVKITTSENNTDSGVNEGERNGEYDLNNATDSYLDIDTGHGKDPLLVVFSKKSDTHERMSHERDKRDAEKRETYDISLNINKKEKDYNSEFTYTNNEIWSSDHYFDGFITFFSTLGKDSSLNNPANNKTDDIQDDTSLQINDHSQNVTDKEDNKLLNSVYKSTFLNNTNNHQKSINDASEQKSNKTDMNRNKIASHIHLNDKKNLTLLKAQILQENVESVTEKNENSQLSENMIKMRVRRDTKRRYRRHLDSLFRDKKNKVGARFKRSKKKRNSCQRDEMYVDFETIKWDKVIIFPRGYQAFECTGKCYTPISEYLTPSKHAIIQTLVHTSYPDQASRACCVPTKLDPISILYWDENGDIKYDYSYEGMVVAECGCR